MAGAVQTTLANPLPSIASDAAVGFWYFFPTEKGLGPRGYERDEIMIGWWVTPTTGKPFIASGAAVAFWFFSAKGKELGPRGLERNEIIIGWWVTPTTGKIASGAAVAFIRCCLLFFKGAHGLVVPSRHGTFFLQKKY